MSKRTLIKVNQTKFINESCVTKPERKPKLKGLFIRAMGSKLITKSLYQKVVPTPRRTYGSYLMVLMNPFVEIPKVLW